MPESSPGTPPPSAPELTPTQSSMGVLTPPTPEEFDHITAIQMQRERDAQEQRRCSHPHSPSHLHSPTHSYHSHHSHHSHHHHHNPTHFWVEGHGVGKDAIDTDGDGDGDGDGNGNGNGDADVDGAARVIQKTYRGYRTRRELNLVSLNASTRWLTALREARFREQTRPKPPTTIKARPGSPPGVDAQHRAQEHNEGPSSSRTNARDKWKKATAIAQRANYDPHDTSSDSSSSDSDSYLHSHSHSHSCSGSGVAALDRAERRRKRAETNAHRRQEALMIKMDYFLEMVDLKHRYGSNLRSYHEIWKNADTRENFFYWLDHGEGKDFQLASCPRERLEREQVRYLSREERQYYLVMVDEEGRLCWAKNGQRIDTTVKYKDSMHGIVPLNDATPAYVPSSQAGLGTSPASPATTRSRGSHASSASSSGSSLSAAARYPAPALDQAKGLRKMRHVSVSTIINRLLRRTVRKNTWIFVADTRFRLYVGIKASGAFQHSSFLQGSRISAAGLIRISNGRLRSLSPLSGHYRPPASSFRAFVSSLRAAGVDMGRVSISKAYVVLLGLEAYVRTREKGKNATKILKQKTEEMMHPGLKHKREEEAQDKSQSAKREKLALSKEADERIAREQQQQQGGVRKAMARLGLSSPKLAPAQSK